MTQALPRSATLNRIVDFYNQFSPASIAQMQQLYTADAYFRDPFQEVKGISELERIFSHMYVNLLEPSFVIIETIEQQQADQHHAFLTWDFQFRFKRFSPTQQRVIRGSSHLRFTADGQVAYHRDYWDAADLYAELPVVGRLMAYLKKQAGN
jgi:steroid Delta-isomerase